MIEATSKVPPLLQFVKAFLIDDDIYKADCCQQGWYSSLNQRSVDKCGVLTRNQDRGHHVNCPQVCSLLHICYDSTVYVSYL